MEVHSIRKFLITEFQLKIIMKKSLWSIFRRKNYSHFLCYLEGALIVCLPKETNQESVKVSWQNHRSQNTHGILTWAILLHEILYNRFSNCKCKIQNFSSNTQSFTKYTNMNIFEYMNIWIYMSIFWIILIKSYL